MKIYSALYATFNPFRSFYPEAELVYLEEGDKVDHDEPGFLIMHGGSDIHPSLYGRANMGSHVGVTMSTRDRFEAKVFADAVKVGMPIFGICRGAQLGCAMSGGILVQHVDGHSWGSHRLNTDEGKQVLSNSIHHQMMYPWAIEHKLIAWSAIPRSTVYDGVTAEEIEKWPTKEFDAPEGKTDGLVEPEIVWFPQTKCLAVQGHPEMLDSKSEFNRYMKQLVDTYFFGNVPH